MTKTCSKCGEEKSISEYYRRSNTKCGTQSECKVCHKAHRKDYDRSDEQAKQRAKFPEKYKARTAVSNALRDGRLEKQPCECGEVKVEAHHPDYGKPLDVMWMCSKCHGEKHA